MRRYEEVIQDYSDQNHWNKIEEGIILERENKPQFYKGIVFKMKSIFAHQANLVSGEITTRVHQSGDWKNLL